MITAEEYLAITGEEAPDDFAQSEAAAADRIHAMTLYAYVSRDLNALPVEIADRLRRAVALQTQYVSLQGGAAAAGTTGEMSSVKLGDFSYTMASGTEAKETTTQSVLAPAVSPLLPLLIAYGRGLRVCSRCP